MTARRRIAFWLALAALGAAVLAAGAPAQSGTAYSITLEGTLDPVSGDYLTSQLENAAEQGAELAIVVLDTPGGLAESAEDMAAAISSAPMPVVVYIAPSGGKAEGAGLELLEAADVAAITPGAVVVEDDKELSADAAVDAGLVDLVAPNEEALLAEIDGLAAGAAGTIGTEGLELSEHEMSALEQIEQILVNPNIAYLLLLVGLAGIGIELLSPGLFFPGTVGVIALGLGIYGAAQLPVELIGVLLMIAGGALVIAEAYLPTGGIIGIFGIAALIGAGLTLFDTGSDALEVELPVIVAVAAVVGGLGIFIGDRVLRAQRQERVMTGWEEMPGSEGDVRVALNPIGQVFVEGALWRARTREGQSDLAVGEQVRVLDVDGLTLTVERVESADATESNPNEGD
jgi:membrane-bound serine protease (ClpP class)